MIKIVLDTNVFISALISEGKPRKLLKKALDKEVLVITSREALEEFIDVLRRPKFEMSEDSIHKAVFGIMQTCEIVKTKSDFKTIEEDPNDNVFLNAAYDSKADYIVSGDRHLLELGNFGNIKIATVDQILRILDKQ